MKNSASWSGRISSRKKFSKMEELDHIKKKQAQIHRKFVREGWYYKLICLLTIYPILYLCYLMYGPDRQRRDRLDDTTLIYFLLVIGLIMALIIVFTNPIKFINDYRVRRENRLFKKDFFDLASQYIPELDQHNPVQKLHPALFRESGLFSGWQEAYTGDDFMSGIYLGKRFDLGELHVLNSFKTVFRGIYLAVYIKTEPVDIPDKLKQINSSEEFLKLAAAYEIKSAYREGRFYLAVSREELFFENHNKQHIEKLNKDLALLKAAVEIGKKAIAVFEG